ncbi:MAG: TldD/PmbA family protein [Clostridia bacterium]|nr:TldD/PmbA family protein [Clostridia bacterium]
MRGLGLCQRLVERALAMGADGAEVFYRKARTLEAVFEKNDLQVPKGDAYEGIGIRVTRTGGSGASGTGRAHCARGANGAKQGFAATNILSDEALDDSLRAAMAIAEASPEDPNVWLPQPSPVYAVPGLCDDSAYGITLRDALEQGRAFVDSARGYDPRVTVDSASYSVELAEKAIASSTGIGLSERRTTFSCVGMGFAVDGESMSSFDLEVAASCRKDGIDPAAAGRRLGEKVVASLGASTAPGFKGSVIITPYAAMDLIIEPVLFSVNAENVQGGRSRWKGMLGSVVASPLLSIVDDPGMPGGVSSTSFDREGTPPRALEIVKDGVLGSYLHNCRTARKDGVASNGHAAGGDENLPEVGPTNVIIASGRTPLSDMIRNCSKALIVNRFSGNVDPVSGDFSGVVKGGQYIAAGAVVCPVKEAMIAGNIYELLKQVVDLSKETLAIAEFTVPYIQLDGCSVTGK